MTSDFEKRNPLLIVLCVVIAVVLVAPTLVVLPMSFTSKPSFEFPPPGWSTQWYRHFFSDPDWYRAAWLSLRVGVVVVILATTLGTMAAFGLTRGRGRWVVFFRGLLMAPIIVPGVITAIGIYYVFLRWRLASTYQGFVLAHTVLAIPLVIVPISAALQTFDRRLEQAAASLGAGPITTFRTVTLPLILPSVLTGALFAFLTSFDEALVSLFLSSAGHRTLPVQLYQSVTTNIDPTIAAASSMIIVLTTSLLLIAAIIGSRRRTRRV